MKNKSKRFVAAVMSATIMANPLVYVDAKNSAEISFSQKVKNGIQSIRNIIKDNAREIAILGIGGGGLFALAFMGIMCNKKSSRRVSVGCESQTSQDSAEKPVLGTEFKLTNLPLETGVSMDLGTDSKSETEAKTEAKPNPATVAVIGAKLEFEFAPEAETKFELKKPVLPETSGSSEDELEEDMFYELNKLFGNEEEGGTPQKTIMLPKFGADVDDDPISRTPSPGSDIVEMNDELKDVRLMFSEALNRQIGSFCGSRYSVDGVRAIIEFLAKIKNRHHRGRNITSLVEANFTRCEQKINGFNLGERTVDCEVIKEFKGRLAAIGKQFGVAQWKEFKEKLLRGVVLHENRLKFDVRRLVIKMK